MNNINNNNEKKFGVFGDYDKAIFWSTVVVMTALLIFGFFFQDAFANLWNGLQNGIVVNFGWFYMLLVFIVTIFLIFVAVSKYGSIRLGPPESRPEYSNFSWISMLFSAGVGIGFIFWGVAEPVLHYMETPYLAEPASGAEALRVSLAISTSHWGSQVWSLFAVCGLAMAVAAYRLNKPLLVSSCLHGLFGEKTNSSAGRFVDFLSVIAAIAGISTTLGMGVMSISFAASYFFGFTNTVLLNAVIMFIMVTTFIVSSASGIKKGMKRVSEFSIYLAIFVMLFILCFGPTRFMLNSLVYNLGGYLDNFLFINTWTDPVEQSGWLSWWTVFYWGWWIAWTPYSAGFIAKISKGRTVREFLIGVLIVPGILTLIWFSILGGASIFAQINSAVPGVGVDLYTALKADTASGIYILLTTYPFTTVMSVVLILNMLSFIVTSADASAFYCASVMSKGSLEPKPQLKIVTGIIIGLTALFLLSTGGLKSLQTMSVVGAFPFAFVIALTIPSLYKMLDHAYCEDHGIIKEVKEKKAKVKAS